MPNIVRRDIFVRSIVTDLTFSIATSSLGGRFLDGGVAPQYNAKSAKFSTTRGWLGLADATPASCSERSALADVIVMSASKGRSKFTGSRAGSAGTIHRSYLPSDPAMGRAVRIDPRSFDLTTRCLLRGYRIRPFEILRGGWSLIRFQSCGQDFDSMAKEPSQSTSRSATMSGICSSR
jgi:hypothetical protein